MMVEFVHLERHSHKVQGHLRAERMRKKESRPAKKAASLYLNLLKQAGAPLAWSLSGLRLAMVGSQHKAPEFCSLGINIGSVLVPEQHR